MKSELSIGVKAEIADIFASIKLNPDAKEIGAKLISKLKSEAEGRGKIDPEKIDKLRMAFEVLCD